MIHGVLIAWRLDAAAIRTHLRHVRGRMAALVIVDNSSAPDPARWDALRDDGWNVLCIMNRHNAGVARALNQGITAALERGADFVLLLDEDSTPQAGMVDELARVWEQRKRDGERVAAVGANFTERHSGRRAVYARVRGMRIEKQGEELFVDYVDTEWCWRARSLGYGCFGACRAGMEHGFGESALQFPFQRAALPNRPPSRSYYIFRNTLLLLRADYIPLRWKLNALKRLVLLFLACLVSAPDRILHCRMMFSGLWHGVAGRGGPLHAGPVCT